MKREVDDYGTIKYFNEQQQLHREDGPALIYEHGSKHWYQNGDMHRLDGPAYERWDGHQEYWINGQEYTEEEFKLIAFTLGLDK